MGIKFESENLTNYIGFRLDKLEDEFTEEELNTLTELVIDYEPTIDINLLKYFKNLETLELRNFDIDEHTIENIIFLKKLKNLKFQLCTIDSINKLNQINLTGLHLDCCEMKDYSIIYEMTNLTELSLTGQENIDINKINNLTNLKYLNISHTICTKDVLNLKNIEELYIDNTNIENIEFTLDMPKLIKLGLSDSQYNNKTEIINKLKQKNIQIYDYGIMLLGEE